jgi:predicted glycosyltransferase involved in capsule biosynthesis
MTVKIKHDFNDITFLIPIRLDSIYRLENLLLSIDFLQKYFETNIKVLEAYKYKNRILEGLLPRNVEYVFIKDRDPVFHRTKYQNLLLKDVETPYISIWEADIIAQPELMIDAITQLRENKAEAAFPYNGTVMNVSPILRAYYAKNRDMDFLQRNKDKMDILYDRTDLVGGAILLNKEAYIKAGKDNEKFYGWGNEDFERMHRWKVLEYCIFRADGHLYHLCHSRGHNSIYKSNYYTDFSLNLLIKTKLSSKEEILKSLE